MMLAKVAGSYLFRSITWYCL